MLRFDVAVELYVPPETARIVLCMTSSGDGIRGRMARRLGLLRFVLHHPVNRSHRAQALARYGGWQAWRHLVRQPLTVSFWNVLRVRVYPDWPYSWMAIYVGLTEYDEMMFTLRYLRPGDAVVDVGANIGFYSLLASSANARADVLAIEPHPLASARLRENVALNSFGNIHVREAAAGDKAGTSMITANLFDQNRIWTADEGSDQSLSVPLVTLDAELTELGIDPASVALVKVDTEGFEASVLAGAGRLLNTEPGPVWIVELTGLGTRYGSGDAVVRAMFAELGYLPLRYDAASNGLTPDDALESGNVIFAREPWAVAGRLDASLPVPVSGS